MDALNTSALLPIIQLAITPVILISGVGALMLTLTNRMARIVDRTRTLAGLARQLGEGDERQHVETQLGIMWRRAKLIRMAVTFAGLSMLVACGLVIVIFANAVLDGDLVVLLVVCFMASILLLIAALGAFLRDIYVSLQALHLEVLKARRSGE
jgi:hypothetical protein